MTKACGKSIVLSAAKACQSEIRIPPNQPKVSCVRHICSRRGKTASLSCRTATTPPPSDAVLIVHDPRCTEYSAPAHPERSARIQRTVPLLQDQHPSWEWKKPTPAGEKSLLRAHSPEHIARIREAAHDFDADTPAYPNIYEHALRSAGAAVDAAH